jgi:hypothetical protein
MKKSILKSIGALLAGIATGVILSLATDAILEKTGLMKTNPFDANPSWVIIGVIIYRTVYNIAGAYLTARLAPDNPMKHVLLLGILGLAVGVLGTVVMWHIPPHWYPIALDILALPSAWLGGILAIRKTTVIR